MADPLTIIGGVVSLVSTGLGVMGEMQAARDQKEADLYKARQLDAKAKAETAQASREAAEEDRQRKLVLSKARAIGAASGSDRAFDVEGALDAEGEFRTLSALWEGENQAQATRRAATTARYDADIAKRAGFRRAAATGISGATSLFNKYSGALKQEDNWFF